MSKLENNDIYCRPKEYTVKMKCGCIYDVYAESKGHADCQVDYLHYIDTERDKTRACKAKEYTPSWKQCAICKAGFRPNKKAKTTETRQLCLKCRREVKK